MSCFAYDELWRDGVEQLERLLRDEERRGAWAPRDALPPAEPLPVSGLAALLLRYGRALRTLDAAHAGAVEPQKRRDVEAALHACMGRLLEVRAELSRRSAGALLEAAAEAAAGGGKNGASSSASSSLPPPALIESLTLEEARQLLRLGEEDAADVPAVPQALLRSDGGTGDGSNGNDDNTNLSRAAVLAQRARFLDALLDKYNMAAAAAAAAAAMASSPPSGEGGHSPSPPVGAAAKAAASAAAAATAEAASLGLLPESTTATGLVSRALPAAVAPAMTLDQALDLLARCELGRQGRARAAVVAATAARAAARGGGGSDDDAAAAEEEAALCLQSAARGWAARRQRREDEAAERALLGVPPAALVPGADDGGGDDDNASSGEASEDDDSNVTTTATASTGTTALRRRHAPSSFLERPLYWSGRAARIARDRDARRGANATALTAALPGLLEEARRGDEAAGCRLQVRRRLDYWVAGLEERQRKREEDEAAAVAAAAASSDKAAAAPKKGQKPAAAAAPPRGNNKGGAAAAAAEAAAAAAAASAAAAAAAAEWPPRLPAEAEGGSLRLLHPIPAELRELLDEEAEVAAKRAAEEKEGAAGPVGKAAAGAKKGGAAAKKPAATAPLALGAASAQNTNPISNSAFLPRVAAAVARYAEAAERRQRRALCANAEAEQRAAGYDADRAREELRALVAEEARREVEAEVRAELAEAERARAAAAVAAGSGPSGGGEGASSKKKKKGKEGEGKAGDKKKKGGKEGKAKAKNKGKKGKGDGDAAEGLALSAGANEAAAASMVVAALDRSIESLFSELASNGVVVRLAPPSAAADGVRKDGQEEADEEGASARLPLLRTFVGGDDCALPRPSAREVEAAVATLAAAVTPAAVAEVSVPGAGSSSNGGKKGGVSGSAKKTGGNKNNNARAGPPAAQPPSAEVLEAAKRRAQEAERAARAVLRRALALSPAQVRSAVAAHCVLPLAAPPDVRAALAGGDASAAATANLVAPRSILLYGPPGAGKTLVAQAAAREAGALMLDLSPRQLGARYPGAAAADALVRAAFGVARALAPTIVHIDSPELLFGEGKAPSSSSSPGTADGAAGARLLTAYSRWRAPLEREVAALSPADRVVVVGCSARPSAGTSEFVGMWDRTVRLSPPGYGSRRAVWVSLLLRTARAVVVGAVGAWDDDEQKGHQSGGGDPAAATSTSAAERRRRRRLLSRACGMLEAQLRVQTAGGLSSSLPSSSAAAQAPPQPLDAGGLSTLALLSEGLTPGSIEGVCRAVLTARRLARMVPGELGGGGPLGGGGGLGAGASSPLSSSGPLRLAELLEWLPAASAAAAAAVSPDSTTSAPDYDAFEAAVLARGCGPMVGGLFAAGSGGGGGEADAGGGKGQKGEKAKKDGDAGGVKKKKAGGAKKKGS